jgi:hypothetical protein
VLIMARARHTTTNTLRGWERKNVVRNNVVVFFFINNQTWFTVTLRIHLYRMLLFQSSDIIIENSL